MTACSLATRTVPLPIRYDDAIVAFVSACVCLGRGSSVLRGSKLIWARRRRKRVALASNFNLTCACEEKRERETATETKNQAHAMRVQMLNGICIGTGNILPCRTRAWPLAIVPNGCRTGHRP